jgi:hypothetical protein
MISAHSKTFKQLLSKHAGSCGALGVRTPDEAHLLTNGMNVHDSRTLICHGTWFGSEH